MTDRAGLHGFMMYIIEKENTHTTKTTITTVLYRIVLLRVLPLVPPGWFLESCVHVTVGSYTHPTLSVRGSRRRRRVRIGLSADPHSPTPVHLLSEPLSNLPNIWVGRNPYHIPFVSCSCRSPPEPRIQTILLLDKYYTILI